MSLPDEFFGLLDPALGKRVAEDPLFVQIWTLNLVSRHVQRTFAPSNVEPPLLSAGTWE